MTTLMIYLACFSLVEPTAKVYPIVSQSADGRKGETQRPSKLPVGNFADADTPSYFNDEPAGRVERSEKPNTDLILLPRVSQLLFPTGYN